MVNPEKGEIMNELPGLAVLAVLADEVASLEGWRAELVEGDAN